MNKIAVSTNEIFALLQDLGEVTGLSGMEQPLVRLLVEKFSPLADDVQVDAFGNLTAIRYGHERGQNLMIAAHSDEVGGVVTTVTPDGFLRFRPVGVVSPTVLPATRVRVNGTIPGVVVCPPGHASRAEQGREDMLIDIGAENNAKAAFWGIEPGSGVTFDSPLISMNDPNLVMGRALDNHIGCVELLKTFELLQNVDLPDTLFGVVTVQEEIGMRGARLVASRLCPNFAIALDTVPLDDTPLHSLPDAPFHIGAGPVIQLWEGKPEQFLGTVAHPGVTTLIRETAARLEIPVQLSAAYGMWVTDGAAIHTAGQGIPTGFISTPRRYGHTPNEVINLTDAQAAIRILVALTSKSCAGFKPVFF